VIGAKEITQKVSPEQIEIVGPTEGPKVIQAINIIHIKRLRRILLGEYEA